MREDQTAVPHQSPASLESGEAASRSAPRPQTRASFPLGSIILMAVMMAVAFGAGMLVERRATPVASALSVRGADQPADFKTFWQAWDIVQRNYFDRQTTSDTKTLTQGAIRGMVDALGDEGHTYYLPPKAARAQQEALQGSFDGIGAQVTVRDSAVQILAPIPDSPAEKAGVRAGDVILKVDGEDVRDQGLDYVVSKIRGKAGTNVTITFLRPKAEPPQFELTITRSKISNNPTTSAYLPDSKIAIIRLAQFNQEATNTVQAAIKAARANGATGLVIDMRNNPGGLFQQAIDVTSQFLPEGTPIVQQRGTSNTETFKATGGGVALDLPIAVLTNRGSASAAEIFAGAIKSAGRGKVIGDRTFGTGTVLNPYQLEDGGAIYLATAEWLTPDGRSLRRMKEKNEEGGVEPDVSIPLPLNVFPLSPAEARELSEDAVWQTKDVQMLEALKTVRQAAATR